MNKICKIIFSILLCLALFSCNSNEGKEASNNKQKDYFVASYYFGNYHVDKRNEKVHGAGWTEWELVKAAKPRFANHQLPDVPAWGYTDEADPKDMAQKIDAAADYGIDAFIFDWYYYNDGLFLERAIEDGFFGAKNNDRIKFALHWANHDWLDIHPVDSATLKQEGGPEILYPGAITPATWETMTDYVIKTYFKHPSYWQIDGAPYFSVYDLTRFVESFGSVDATNKAVEAFRAKVKKAGFKELHLNAVVWGQTILPSEDKLYVDDLNAFLKKVGFASATSYVWIHHVPLDFPTHEYNDCKKEYNAYADKFAGEIDLPYYPNVTMGWDSSPRAAQTDELRNIGYPFMGALSNNTPENFKLALADMKDYLDKHPKAGNIFNINCWNEWTEGSYLEPDQVNGMAYLEAIRDVFMPVAE